MLDLILPLAFYMHVGPVGSEIEMDRTEMFRSFRPIESNRERRPVRVDLRSVGLGGYPWSDLAADMEAGQTTLDHGWQRAKPAEQSRAGQGVGSTRRQWAILTSRAKSGPRGWLARPACGLTPLLNIMKRFNCFTTELMDCYYGWETFPSGYAMRLASLVYRDAIEWSDVKAMYEETMKKELWSNRVLLISFVANIYKALLVFIQYNASFFLYSHHSY